MCNLTEKAAALGLVRLAPPDKPFPGRRGPAVRYAIDTRGAGANVELRTLLVRALSQAMTPFEPVEAVVGVSRSGVTWGAWLALHRGLPYATALPEGPRPIGLQRAVEGDVAGCRVVVVENVTRSGESLRDSIKWLEAAGAQVIGALVFAKYPTAVVPVPVISVFDVNALLKAAGLDLKPHAAANEERIAK